MARKIKNDTIQKVITSAGLLVILSLLVAIIYKPQMETIFFSIITVLFVFVPFVLSFNQCFGMLVFLNCFSGVYKLFWFRKAMVLFMFAFLVKYIISILKKRKRPIVMPFIISLGILCYSFYNFNYDGIGKLFDFLIMLGSLYLIIAYYHEIDKKKITYYLVWGILFSSIFALVIHYLPFARNQTIFHRTRFMALTMHTNTLQVLCVIALSCVLSLFLNKKMKIYEFVVVTFLLIGIGMTTKSKGFLISLCVLTLVYLIYMLIKNKKMFFASLIIVGVLALVFKDKILEIVVRFSSSKRAEFLDMILTGRYSIWKQYWDLCTSSVKTLLFGFGSSANAMIAGSTHNTFLELMYRYGLVGIGLFIILNVFYILHIRKHYGLNKRFSWFIPLLMFLLLGVEESLIPLVIFTVLVSVAMAKNELDQPISKKV